jgi:cell division protein FtsN
MERSYLEVKVSFLHIVVMLVGVIIIGSFLFYLGYQAGKSASESDTGQQAELLEGSGKPEEIQLSDTVSKKAQTNQQRRQKPSISDELKLHQLPAKPEQKPAVTVRTKPVKRESYYSIQVGAFSEYANAKKYSAKFADLGYPTEILTTVQRNKNLYRVRVGRFKNRPQAVKVLKKLERMEKKKFAVINPN